MDTTFNCDLCGAQHSITEAYDMEGLLICPDCLRQETEICQHCGTRIWRGDNAGDVVTPLCQSCYDMYYTRCSDCNEVIYESEAYYLDDDEDTSYCVQCAEGCRRSSGIHAYSYKPNPIFRGDGARSRFFGVELEIDEGGEDEGNARVLLKLADSEADELIYCKSDGSLSEGFEIVSHPFTLNFHTQVFPWEEILYRAAEMGYLSHSTDTAGLHIHVNRTAFGDTEMVQDRSIARILYFIKANWNELLHFSRRTQYQMNRWAARYGYKEHPADILDHAKKGYGGGRYSCINLQNYNTIEFRIFRGTLKYNIFIATLQVVNHICDVALVFSDEEMKDLSWSRIEP